MFPEHSYRLCIWMFVVKRSNRIWTTNPRWFQIQVWSGQSFFFCVPDSKSQTKPSFFVVSQFPPFVVIFFELHLGSRLNNIYAVCLQLRIIRFICHSVLLIYFSPPSSCLPFMAVCLSPSLLTNAFPHLLLFLSTECKTMSHLWHRKKASSLLDLTLTPPLPFFLGCLWARTSAGGSHPPTSAPAVLFAVLSVWNPNLLPWTLIV